MPYSLLCANTKSHCSSISCIWQLLSLTSKDPEQKQCSLHLSHPTSLSRTKYLYQQFVCFYQQKEQAMPYWSNCKQSFGEWLDMMHLKGRRRCGCGDCTRGTGIVLFTKRSGCSGREIWYSHHLNPPCFIFFQYMKLQNDTLSIHVENRVLGKEIINVSYLPM